MSMARIKSVLTERKRVHDRAVELVAIKEGGMENDITEGDLLMQHNQNRIHKKSEFDRRIRKRLNFHKRRQPLFT